jgi:5,5'-dehydrodivanillate O-demethylase
MKENFDYVHTGPATRAGTYLRRFWQPIYAARSLAVRQAVPVHVMGEEFGLYRGVSGCTHLVDLHCPHRGAQLTAGWVQGEEIRCFYHGWKFAANGACIEQPLERKPFCDKVGIRSYPTAEHLGLIFAYLGDGTPPELPRWPEFERQEHVASVAALPCNYFQSAENIVDYCHPVFAHRGVATASGQSAQVLADLSCEETPYGFRVCHSRQTEEVCFLMPNGCYISYELGHVVPQRHGEPIKLHTLFWYVPIDDYHHNHFMVTTGDARVVRFMREECAADHNVAKDIEEVLSGRSTFHMAGPAQITRPEMVRLQDGVAIVGQGRIANRNADHLGSSDEGVIMLRKLWLRELGLLSSGGTPKKFRRMDSLSV